MMVPTCDSVAALYCFTKSMIADAVRPERGTHGRGRGGLACGDLDLDDRSNLFLCHD
jgi:hypothetical protein